MRLIIKLTIRSIQRRPLRTLLSMLGIMIGVAGILALGITNQASMDSITQLFEESSGKTDLMITAASGNETISDNALRTVSYIQEVNTILPILKAQTALAEQVEMEALELNFFGMESGGLLLHGIDPLVEPSARDYNITGGRFLDGASDEDEIVLVENYAEDEEIEVDEYIEIITPNGVERFKVVGLMAREGPGQTNNGAFGVITIDNAQVMFDRISEYDQLDLLVNFDDGSDLERIRLAIQDRLGTNYSVTYPAGQGERMTQMLSNYQIGLNFLSVIALFVGAFLIYNAFAMTVVERTREFGMLRTIGMTRKQIVGQVLMEAFTLGILGSALGVLLGILSARGLTSVMGSLIGSDITSDLSVPVDTLMISLIVGIGVTIFSALMPSIKAGRVSPIAALRIRGRSQDSWIIRYGWLLGLVMLGSSTALLIWNPFPYDPQFTLGSITVLLMFGGITLVIPVSVSIWERITRPIMRFFYGNSGTIGSRNIERAKARTTITVAALLIGVAMILVVRAMTSAFSVDLTEWISAYLGGDIYVYSNVPLRSDLPNQLLNVSGVEAATPIHYQPVDLQINSRDTEALTFMAIDVPSYIQVTDFVFSDSNVNKNEALIKLNDGGAVFISSVLAEKYGLQPGDQLVLKTKAGVQPFEVAAVVVDFYNRGLVITGNRHDLRRYFRVDDVSTVLIKVQDNVQVSAVMDDIENSYGKRFRLNLESNDSVRASIFTLLDQAFSMFDVMGVLAVIIASLGVVNTLTMNIMERTQEIGMLRAIGMTRGQVVMMVLAEASLMGVIGGLIGIVFGILLSRIFLTGMAAMSGYSLTFILPTVGILIGLIVSIVVSQIAAIQPARKAASTNVLEAIRYE
jgi:putative ABC transport system permease protein